MDRIVRRPGLDTPAREASDDDAAPAAAPPQAARYAGPGPGPNADLLAASRWLDAMMTLPPPPQFPVQKRAAGEGTDDPAEVQRAAADGVRGPATALPHLDTIQRSFGAHDVSHVQAHVGGDAATAAGAIGASAYATGDHVAFAASPDLHTAAHEAAHVVQQRQGVQLYGGVGQAGDAHERQADAVADAVVAGESAEPLLGPATQLPSASAAVQRKDAAGLAPHSFEFDVDFVRGKSLTATGRVVLSFQGGVDATDSQPGDASLELSVLKPKVVENLRKATSQLEAAVIESGFQITVIDGLSVGLEVGAFEMSGDDADTFDVTALKVAALVKGDVRKLLARVGHPLDLPGLIGAEVELEVSFTVGGELLSKLAGMAAAHDRIVAKTKELRALTDDLDATRARARTLRAERAALLRDAPTTGGHAGRHVQGRLDDAVRKAHRQRLGELERLIAYEEDAIKTKARRARDLGRQVRADTKAMGKMADGLDGRIARSLGHRITGKAHRAVSKAVATLLPILNAVGVVADVLAVIEFFEDWRRNDFDLPLPTFDGGGDPWGGAAETGGEGDDGMLATEGAGEGAADGVGAPRTDEDRDTPSGKDARDADVRADRDAATTTGGHGAGTGDGATATADDRPLHEAARKIVRAMQRWGFPLDADQIALIGAIIPADLDDDDLRALLQRVLAAGRMPDDVHEMIGLLDQAVRERETWTTSVDGEEVADAPEDDGEVIEMPAEDRPTPARGRRKGKGEGKAAKGKTRAPAGDQRPSVNVAVVRTWFEIRKGRLVTTDAFEAWKVEHLGELTGRYGGKEYQLIHADAAGSIIAGGLWDVEVALLMAEYGGDRQEFERFRFVIDPVNEKAAEVSAIDIKPIERVMSPPTATRPVPYIAPGQQVKLDGMVVEIVEAIPMTTRANDDGSWPMQVAIKVVSIAGSPPTLLNDRGEQITMEPGKRFAKTLDLVPRGR